MLIVTEVVGQLELWRHKQIYACSVVSTLWDLMDWSPPDSFVHGIVQARVLEWIAISSSRKKLQGQDLPDPGTKPMSAALQANSLPLSYLGSP